MPSRVGALEPPWCRWSVCNRVPPLDACDASTACTRPGLPPRQDEIAAENVTVVLDASLGRCAATSLAC
jgi:hypothetical protein